LVKDDPFFKEIEGFGFKILSNLYRNCPIDREALFGRKYAGQIV
jgi:hypothetical protein